MIGKQRYEGVELFRCLLMFFIVLHHTYIHGIFGPDDGMMNLAGWWNAIFVALIAWNVDGFVAISGWFGINFSWRKFFSLWGVMAFYGCINVLGSYFLGHPKFGLSAIYISGGWFGGSYLMLMLFAPFLNSAVKYLSLQGREYLLSAFMLLSIGMFFAWFPRNAFTAISPTGVGSHTFFGMVFVYLAVRSLHELIQHPIPLTKLLIGGLVFPIGIVACSCYGAVVMISHHLPVQATIMNSLSGYTAPHVCLFAIVLLLIFLWHVKVPKHIGAICRFIGPSVFGIYLMHDVVGIGQQIYWIPERYMYNQLGLHPVICIFIAAIIVYACCLAIDYCRRLVVGMLRPRLMPLLDKIDSAWNALMKTL